MLLARRKFLTLAIGAGSAAANASVTASYPLRPVRIVVSTAPGGAPDVVGRLIAQRLSERLSPGFFVENRPGGASNIGNGEVIRAEPDGSTLLLVDGSGPINATLYNRLSFDFMRDISFVAPIVKLHFLMVVNPSLPVNTLGEFIQYAKANPGKINMASPGIGTGPHVTGELFRIMSGLDLVHIPYRGGAAVLTDLMSNQVQLFFGTTSATMEHVRAGTLRALAVTTSSRWEVLPDLPAVNEFVSGYESDSLFGLGAPKETPMNIISMLNREVTITVGAQDTKQQLENLGGTVLFGTPNEFKTMVSQATEKWGKVIRAANIRPQ